MKEKVTESRQQFAARLETLARRIRAGEPLVIGAISAAAGEVLEVELELEKKGDATELEVEATWRGTGVAPSPLVGILTGSPSDLETVQKAKQVLDDLGVPSELNVLSAHRTPDRTVAYVRSAEQRGIEVLIACAGMAAHLAGVVAAHTTLPVIGVPLASGALSGIDALLSTVQMPPGIPVATVAIDGARNAAFLAARILGGKYPEIRRRVREAMEAERKRYEEGAPRAGR